MNEEEWEKKLLSRLRRVAGQMTGLEALVAKREQDILPAQFEATLGALKAAYVFYLEGRITFGETDKTLPEIRRILRKLL